MATETNLTKAAFAMMCGLKSNALSVYASRGKVIVSTDDTIDASNPVNEEFLKNRLAKINKVETDEPVASKAEVHEANEVDQEAFDATLDQGIAISELSKKQKIASLQKTLREVELLKLKTQKINAEVIPTSLVKDVTVRMAKALQASYKDAWEDFLTTMSGRHRLSGEDLAKYRGEMVQLINEAHERGIESVKRDIAVIISQYRETRTKGEKK